jgi:hypothetical protein
MYVLVLISFMKFESQPIKAPDEHVDIDADRPIIKEMKMEFDPKNLTFLIKLDNLNFDDGLRDRAIRDGFTEKSEFHVTIIGFKLANLIKKAVKKDPALLERIQSIVRNSHFQIKLRPEVFSIEKEYPDEGLRRSYVQMIDVDGLDEFYRQLGEAMDLDSPIAPPPSHITLFTKGSSQGIGINSVEDFQKLNPVLID